MRADHQIPYSPPLTQILHPRQGSRQGIQELGAARAQESNSPARCRPRLAGHRGGKPPIIGATESIGATEFSARIRVYRRAGEGWLASARKLVAGGSVGLVAPRRDRKSTRLNSS